MSDRRYFTHLGDCLAYLTTLGDGICDSLVTDPPAGISFMGKGWDHDHGGRDSWIKSFAAIFRECFRVMKPGAHGLVWAIPRTAHWTTTALEDAGFEIRDVVVHLFGSGFPKSLDVSRAIDKAAGAEREVIGHQVLTGTAAQSIQEKGGTYSSGGPSSVGAVKTINITAPATDAAKQWDGWGTALKPAAENWVLIRRPLIGTVAANVLAHGTGALNIDASRIFTSENPSANRRAGKAPAREAGTWANDRRSPEAFSAERPGESLGRWPANVVLSHSESCEEVMDLPSGTSSGPAVDVNSSGLRAPRWNCTEDCAIRLLDEQSGVLTSGSRNAGVRKGLGFQSNTRGDGGEQIVGSSGGASRFFYCAKAPKKDKTAGGTIVNGHPTVKSTALMTHLIKLVTPPNGVVLDPFMGSGSTGVAALRNGFRFLGVERDPGYYETALARIAASDEK